MKISTKRGTTILLVFVVLLAIGWSYLQEKETPLLIDMIGKDATRLLTQPYFHIGNLAVTPAFLLKAIIYLLLLALVARKTRSVLHTQVLERVSLDEGQKYAIERTTQYLIYLIGIVIGLQSVGASLASLAVFGGALGIGIGFGLQEIANNFISGLILLFERPIKVGDRVEVGGLDGVVERIGGRSTWVRTNDNIVIVLPNSDFITKPVTNWTANDRLVRFAVPLGVSYGSDPDAVRQVLIEVARANTDVLSHPAPDVIFTGFGDSSLDFELRVWTSTQVHTRQILKSNLYFAIFRAFRKNGIEIPFPQRDLHLRSVEVPIPLNQQPPTPQAY
jgi:small-conductance mechanosensitive channel